MPQTVFISFHTVCLLLNIAAIKWSILTKYKYWFVDKKKSLKINLTGCFVVMKAFDLIQG